MTTGTSMKTRTLGDSILVVSALGYGGMGLENVYGAGTSDSRKRLEAGLCNTLITDNTTAAALMA